MESQLIMSSLKRQNAVHSSYRPVGKPKASVQSVSKAVRRLRRDINRDQELKETTNHGTNSSVSLVGTLQPLLNIAAGTDELNNRIGRKVRWNKLQVAYMIAIGAGVTIPTTVDSITVGIWLDRMPQTATPTFATIYDLANNSGTGGLAHKNTYQTDGRFKCLYMKTHCLSYIGPGAESERFILDLRKLLKAEDQIAQFSGNTQAQPYKNQIYLTYSSYNASPTTAPQMSYNIKALYTDE